MSEPPPKCGILKAVLSPPGQTPPRGNVSLRVSLVFAVRSLSPAVQPRLGRDYTFRGAADVSSTIIASRFFPITGVAPRSWSSRRFGTDRASHLPRVCLMFVRTTEALFRRVSQPNYLTGLMTALGPLSFLQGHRPPPHSLL